MVNFINIAASGLQIAAPRRAISVQRGPVLYSPKGQAMSDERVLHEVPPISGIIIHEDEQREPQGAARFDAGIEVGLTFDDVLLRPARSDIHPNFVDVSTRLTREIR